MGEIFRTRAVLKEIFRTSEFKIPASLEKVGTKDLHLDDLDSYEATTSPGYYGDEAEVVLANPREVHARLQAYYFSRKDAVDSNKILPYLRGKGMDTAGMQPLDAVKKHLRDENAGKRVAYVEKTTNIERATLSVKDIVIPQKTHYKNVASAPSKAPQGAPVTHGIVVRRNGGYHLVDGYHRVKGLEEGKKSTGTFIILS